MSEGAATSPEGSRRHAALVCLALLVLGGLWRARRWLPSVPLRGEQEGFTNILEASRNLDAVVARYDPRPAG